MKLSSSEILNRILPYLKLVKKYGAFIFVVIFLGIYVFLVQHIGQLIQDEPSQAAVESKLKPVNRLKIDQDALQKMNELESQNIDVQSLFDQARQNPFTE